jgi:hypothetical protein
MRHIAGRRVTFEQLTGKGADSLILAFFFGLFFIFSASSAFYIRKSAVIVRPNFSCSLDFGAFLMLGLSENEQTRRRKE